MVLKPLAHKIEWTARSVLPECSFWAAVATALAKAFSLISAQGRLDSALECLLLALSRRLQQGGLWCEIDNHPVTWYTMIATLNDPLACVDLIADCISFATIHRKHLYAKSQASNRDGSRND